MRSITFVTDAGTKIKISNFEYAEVLDVMQAVAVGVSNLEDILQNPTEDANVDDGLVITGGLFMGGGVSIAIPPVDDEDEDEEEELEQGLLQVQQGVSSEVLYTISSPEIRSVLAMGGAAVAEDQSNVEDGYYRCSHCDEIHNIKSVLEMNAELAS